MPIELKGKVRPGEADRRYYMIRVQVAGRRVVVSSGTRTTKRAHEKEGELVEALRANPAMTQAEVVALVNGEKSQRAKTAALKSGGVTMRAGFDRCLEAPEHWKIIKGRTEYVRAARIICEIVGDDHPLSAVDSECLSDIVKSLSHTAERADGTTRARAGNTVNFYLAVLRRMLNICATEGWAGAPRMFPKVPSVPKRDQREFYLSPEDEVAMLEALTVMDDVPTSSPHGRALKRDAYRYRELFLALLEGGLRVREGLNIRWSDIRLPPEETPDDDDFQGSITLGRAEELKRGKRRTVPMTTTLRHLIEGLKKRGDSKQGPFADLKYSRANLLWVKARKAVGITDKDCVIHCTRHTCASRLLEGGAGLTEVKDWLGHTSIATTMRYAHLAQHQLVGAAKKMSRLRSG